MDLTGLDKILEKHIKSVITDSYNLNWKSMSGNQSFTYFTFNFDMDSSIPVTHRETDAIKEITLSDRVNVWWDGHENGFAQYIAEIHYDRQTLIDNLDELCKTKERR